MATTGAGLQEELAERRGAGVGGRGSGHAELLDERARGKGLAGVSPANSHRQAGWRRCSWSRGWQPARSASRQRVRGLGPGSPRRMNIGPCGDGVVDGQADQAGVRRYSDDYRIVRELGEPRRRTGPQHTQPQWPVQPDTASEHPGPGPAAAYPARAGLRAAEPRPLRPEAHSPRPGPCEGHYHGCPGVP
jgi:hypothetical protein